MNKEVNFEIAKLLKEKGYDIPCLKCYLEDGSVQISSGDEGDFEEYNHNQWDNYSAPTISEVIMWMYEKHGIWIYADTHEFGKWCYYYRYNRPHELSSKITENGQFGLDDYNSPTEAYEAAIEYTLKNLI